MENTSPSAEDSPVSAQKSLQGTTIFINLPRKNDDYIKDLERTLYKRGAIISDFLSKRVSHIITDEDVDYQSSSMNKLTVARKYSRSMILVKKSLENSQQQIRNTLSCFDQAKKFGIKLVHISNAFNPMLEWTKNTVDKHGYTSKWLVDQSLNL